MFVVIFASTRNALTRPGVPNWRTRQDMLDRVETDGIVGDAATCGIAVDLYRAGSSRLLVVDYAEWRADFTPRS